MLLIKLIVNWELSTNKVFESLISGVFHSTYHLASITVLHSINPLTHTVLNISKRVFVIAANIVHLNMLIGLLVLLVGCYIYQLNAKLKNQVDFAKMHSNLLLFGIFVHANRLFLTRQVLPVIPVCR